MLFERIMFRRIFYDATEFIYVLYKYSEKKVSFIYWCIERGPMDTSCENANIFNAFRYILVCFLKFTISRNL